MIRCVGDSVIFHVGAGSPVRPNFTRVVLVALVVGANILAPESARPAREAQGIAGSRRLVRCAWG